MDMTETNVQMSDSSQHFQVLCELGDCYTSVGDHNQAQRCYEEAASLEPDDPSPYVGLGVSALQKNQLEDAEIAFRVACRLDGKCAKAYAGLAMAAQQKQEFSRAFDLYMKSLEIDCDNITALLGLFQVSCQMGSFGQVTHYLKLYLESHPGDTSVMYAIAALYMKDGRLEESKEMLQSLLALEPNNNDAVNLLEEVDRGLNETG